MIDINNFDAIEIGLASSKQIRSWSSGEVTKPEKILYFAASIITSVDQEARWRDIDRLEGEMQAELTRLLEEQRQRIGELEGQRDRRMGYLDNASAAGFDGEDDLWRESLDVNVK